MNLTHYVTYDLPIPYKGIIIHPITVKDYLFFNSYADCFTLDKNSIPDVKIIAMTNLEYLYYAIETDPNAKPYLLWFDRVLSLCLKGDQSFDKIEESITRYKRDEQGKPFFMIGDQKYTSDDYENIKAIVCEQNLVELPDENISKQVRDSLEEARRYKDKLSNSEAGTLEDYIISLSMVTGWTFDYIYNLSVRKFINTIKRYDNFVHYKIYLAASMSGMVEFKDKSFIHHWLTSLDTKNKYGDVSVDLDTIQDTISLESAKK